MRRCGPLLEMLSFDLSKRFQMKQEKTWKHKENKNMGNSGSRDQGIKIRSQIWHGFGFGFRIANLRSVVRSRFRTLSLRSTFCAFLHRQCRRYWNSSVNNNLVDGWLLLPQQNTFAFVTASGWWTSVMLLGMWLLGIWLGGWGMYVWASGTVIIVTVGMRSGRGELMGMSWFG